MPEKMRILAPGMMGSMDDELFLGSPGNDMLNGGGGSDRFEGSPGDDSIIGGTGVDYVSYLQSPAGVYVDIGNNFNIDDDDKPPVHGGHAEGDTLTEVEGLFGSVFGDTFRGDHQANFLFGWGGNDVIYGADGNDYIRGESGGDNLYGDGGKDELFGDLDNDKLEGGVGNDKLWGGKGDDVLYGGAGHDLLEGGEGEDTYHGGRGSDTAAYTLSSEAVTINLKYAYDADPTTIGAMGGHADGDTFEFEPDDPDTKTEDESDTQSIENVLGSMHDDMLTGSGFANRLSGGDGDDTLDGGYGNDNLAGGMGDDVLKGAGGTDTLVGGPGADMLSGGDGIDTASYKYSSAAVRVNLSKIDSSTGDSMPELEGGDAEGDTIATPGDEPDIENVIGSDYGDYLRGDDFTGNKLEGGKGDDWDNRQTSDIEGGLFGGGGDDTLAGGEGMDYLSGGAGRDDLWGGPGDDLIEGGEGDDFPLRRDHSIPGDQGAVTPVDAALVSDGFLKAMDDLSDADALDDMGITRGGLFGGAGDDTLVGGAGADYIDGGSGTDTVSYASSADGVGAALPVTINLDTGVHLRGDAVGALGDDYIRNVENVIGSGGNDTITGNDKRNVLDGGDGNDELTGGDGADTFVFKKGGGSDTVTDFDRFENDKLDLRDFELNASRIVRVGTDGSTTIGLDGDGDGALLTTTGEDADTIIVTLSGISSGDVSIDDFIL